VKNIHFIIVLAVVVFTACGGSDDNSGRSGGFGGWDSRGGSGRVTSVETQTITLQPISDQVRSFGTIRAQDVVAIIPQVSNRVTDFYVDLGDTVRAGQRLAKIYDITFKDQVNQAEAQVAQSRIAVRRDSAQYERQKQLLERNLVSESEYEIAFATYRNSIAQFESAKAQLTQAIENLENTIVRSPVRGVVASRTVAIGDLATTGQAMFEIANLVGYESRIFLPVQDWRLVKTGQEVSLRVSNEETVTAKGVVSRKSPQLDPTTGLGEVVITLTNVGASLYPGVLTENIIDIETKERAVVVSRSSLVEKVETVIRPESNTIQLERNYSVFVAKGDTLAELRSLQLGIEQGDRIEVLSGLRPGDKIVTTGQQGLQDGAKIRVTDGSVFASNTTETAPEQDEQASGRRGGEFRQVFADMSPEEIAEVRKKMQSMSREERRSFMDSLRTANTAGN